MKEPRTPRLRALLLVLLAACAPLGLRPAPARVDAWATAARAFAPARWDEVWILERQAGAPAAGSFVAECTSGTPLSVQAVHVGVQLSERAALVDLYQELENPEPHARAARLSLPLPAGAAVTDFVANVDGRRIRGVIRARDEARALYRAARAAGLLASLGEVTGASFSVVLADVPAHALFTAALRWVQPVPGDVEGRELRVPLPADTGVLLFAKVEPVGGLVPLELAASAGWPVPRASAAARARTFEGVTDGRDWRLTFRADPRSARTPSAPEARLAEVRAVAEELRALLAASDDEAREAHLAAARTRALEAGLATPLTSLVLVRAE